MTMTLLILSALVTTAPCLALWLGDTGQHRARA